MVIPLIFVVRTLLNVYFFFFFFPQPRSYRPFQMIVMFFCFSMMLGAVLFIFPLFATTVLFVFLTTGAFRGDPSPFRLISLFFGMLCVLPGFVRCCRVLFVGTSLASYFNTPCSSFPGTSDNNYQTQQRAFYVILSVSGVLPSFPTRLRLFSYRGVRRFFLIFFPAGGSPPQTLFFFFHFLLRPCRILLSLGCKTVFPRLILPDPPFPWMSLGPPPPQPNTSRIFL